MNYVSICRRNGNQRFNIKCKQAKNPSLLSVFSCGGLCFKTSIRPRIHNNFHVFLWSTFVQYKEWRVKKEHKKREKIEEKKGLDTRINSTLCMEWVHSTASTDLLHCKYTQKISSYKFCFIIFVGCIFIYISLLFSSYFFSMLHLNASRSEHKGEASRTVFLLDFQWFSHFLLILRVFKLFCDVRREIMFHSCTYSQLFTILNSPLPPQWILLSLSCWGWDAQKNSTMRDWTEWSWSWILCEKSQTYHIQLQTLQISIFKL